MLRPDLLEPRTIAEAVHALSRPGAMALAGATDLIPALRRAEIRPRLLVNLKRLRSLTGVRRIRAGIRIGALTLVADLLECDLVAEYAPLLAEVAAGFGSPQIRNVATIGGNLCTAAPSADLALPLLALDTQAEVRGPEGVRRMEICEFFRGANKTALRRGELLTALVVPSAPARSGTGYAKLTGRQAMDLALAAAAAAVCLGADGKTCEQARLALGAVAPVPMCARRAESLLAGRPLTPGLIQEAAAAAAAEARPVTDLRASAEYRRDMVAVLARRALEQAACRAAGGLVR